MPVAVVKDRVWPSLQYEPHDGQKLLHNSTVRHRVAACGRRWGKSTAGGHELVPEAVYAYSILPLLEEANKVRRFWIAGPDYNDCEKEFRVIYNDLKKLGLPFDHPGTYNNPQAGSMAISLWNGRFIIETKSGKHPDSMDGEGLSGVLLVEAAKLKPFIWGKYLRPALADEGGWSLSTSTPEGKNWFYKMHQRGQDPAYKAWSSWRMPSWKNSKMFPGGENDPEILAMKSEMSEERFNQQVAALFTDFVGRVFKDFDEELHVTDITYRPDWPLVGAVDYGWTNPFVWLSVQFDVFENVYVLEEYRRTQRDINDVARDLNEQTMAKYATDLYPDPADPGSTAILAKKLHLRPKTNTGGELKWRLELIRQHLKYDPLSEGHPEEKRKPKLYIDRSCSGLITEMLDYRYPDTKEESIRAKPEEPLDKDNHGPEALGRFFRGHFGSAEEAEGRRHAVVRKARILSGRS